MDRLIRVVVAAFVLAGCAPELKKTVAVTAVGEVTGPAVTSMVGPAGGSVRSADGKLELLVPAGALAADTALSVMPLSVTAPGGVTAWRLGPEGTTFARPASVKISFGEAELKGSTPNALRIAFQDSQKRWQAIKTSTVDSTSITVSTTHLSDWSLLLGWQLRPPVATVLPGRSLTLSVRFCNTVPLDQGTESELVSLVANCQEDEGLAPIVGQWAVNGTPNGSATVGTLVPGSPSATYVAPAKAPSGGPVAVSVELNPPALGKVLLVSNITIGGDLPNAYAGAVSYRLKRGGSGTSVLGSELIVSALLSFSKGSGSTASYDLVGGTATLRQFQKETGITNCRCTAADVAGTIEANTGALIIDTSANVVSELQFSAVFTVPLVCNGSTDPACANMSGPEVMAWALTGMNPACTGDQRVSFTSLGKVDGSWNMYCPVNPQVQGRIEEVSWSFDGT
ncbi:MAG: hypothetical protein Q8K32_24650 [Archangium sp.]|nr:hypothetical protein [Archangium sp.]